jgi:hypothetical protein
MAASLTHDQVAAIAGDLDDASIAALLRMDASEAELAEAVARLAGTASAAELADHPATARVNGVIEILAAAEDFADRDR